MAWIAWTITTSRCGNGDWQQRYPRSSGNFHCLTFISFDTYDVCYAASIPPLFSFSFVLFMNDPVMRCDTAMNDGRWCISLIIKPYMILPNDSMYKWDRPNPRLVNHITITIGWSPPNHHHRLSSSLSHLRSFVRFLFAPHCLAFNSYDEWRFKRWIIMSMEMLNVMIMMGVIERMKWNEMNDCGEWWKNEWSRLTKIQIYGHVMFVLINTVNECEWSCDVINGDVMIVRNRNAPDTEVVSCWCFVVDHSSFDASFFTVLPLLFVSISSSMTPSL